MYNVMDMARMIRKQIYIRPEQDEALKRRAKQLGISEAELIRQDIDHSGRLHHSTPWDKSAWERELRFIEERGRLLDLKQERGWTREELYEERFERYSH
jgi:hypothetical protein